MNYISKVKEVDSYLSQNISIKRYIHSVEVAKMSSQISGILNLDKDIAYLAGLSHDIAREQSMVEQLKTIKHFKDLSSEFLKLPILFHGPVGSEFLKNKFDIKNKDILDAVKYHSTGHIDMCDLAKIVYVADYISYDRAHIENSFRDNVLKFNLNEMVLLVVTKTRDYLISKRETILPETDNMYNNLIRILSEKEKRV